MRILGLNYPGGVGKTTILTNVIKPYMPNAKFFAIESINESAVELGVDAEKLSGEQFRDLFSQILPLDEAIVDVGSSNIEDFLEGLAKYEDSHLEFDYYIVPVTSGVKEQKETVSMLLTLQNYGVDKRKIKIVFNRVHKDVEKEFQILMKFFQKNPEFKYNLSCAVIENELFDMLSVKKTSIQEILDDTTDYRSMFREKTTDENKRQKSQSIDIFVTRSLAKTVKKNLDDVYASLFN